MAHPQLVVVFNLNSRADLNRLNNEGFTLSYRFGDNPNPSYHFSIPAASCPELLKDDIIRVQTSPVTLPADLNMH